MMQNEEYKNEIDIYRESCEGIIGRVSHRLTGFSWALSWTVLLIGFGGAWLVKCPSTVMAPICMTRSCPPAWLVASNSGYIRDVVVEDGVQVKRGDILLALSSDTDYRQVEQLRSWINAFLSHAKTYRWLRSHLCEANLLLGPLQQAYNQCYLFAYSYPTESAEFRALATELLSQIESWEDAFLIRSPMDGTVDYSQQIYLGLYVQRGMQLGYVSPQATDAYQGEVKISAAEVSKLKIKGRCTVELEKYNAADYGRVEGVVSKIAENPLPDGSYTVYLKFSKSLSTDMGKTIPSAPILYGTACMAAGDRRLKELILTPVQHLLKLDTYDLGRTQQ